MRVLKYVPYIHTNIHSSYLSIYRFRQTDQTWRTQQEGGTLPDRTFYNLIVYGRLLFSLEASIDIFWVSLTVKYVPGQESHSSYHTKLAAAVPDRTFHNFRILKYEDCRTIFDQDRRILRLLTCETFSREAKWMPSLSFSVWLVGWSEKQENNKKNAAEGSESMQSSSLLSSSFPDRQTDPDFFPLKEDETCVLW